MRRCIDCDIALLPHERFRCNECFELDIEENNPEGYTWRSWTAAQETERDMSDLSEGSEGPEFRS